MARVPPAPREAGAPPGEAAIRTGEWDRLNEAGCSPPLPKHPCCRDEFVGVLGISTGGPMDRPLAGCRSLPADFVRTCVLPRP